MFATLSSNPMATNADTGNRIAKICVAPARACIGGREHEHTRAPPAHSPARATARQGPSERMQSRVQAPRSHLSTDVGARHRAPHAQAHEVVAEHPLRMRARR